MTTRKLALMMTSLVLAGGLTGRAIAATETMDTQVKNAIGLFQQTDSKMQNLFEHAYGYAVFPSVDKGAAGIGAAQGDGEVYEHGRLIGTAKMTQVTLGAQLGGQEYAEVIFFQTKQALDQLKAGQMAIAAEVSAVVAAEGASANAKYRHGVLVFTQAKNGLMFEASVGGQKFTFTPSQ